MNAKRMRQFWVVASIALVAGLSVAVIASAFSEGQDGGVQLRGTVAGPAARKAAAAALRVTRGGQVDAITQNATGGGYDVAVAEPSGNEVGVRLNRKFKPLVSTRSARTAVTAGTDAVHQAVRRLDHHATPLTTLA